ncbi:MAG: polyprenol monophosphomannose synthase, partial [Planctomycetota bacterium]
MPVESSTLVCVATYNELENLPSLVEKIFAAMPDCELLVVDDNSPDGTGKWCDEYAKGDSRLRCLHRPGKLGLGTAAIAGVTYAIEHGYDLLVNLDADHSHDPAVIPTLVSMVREGQCDVAVASRYIKGGRIEGWPLTRRLISKIVNGVARYGLGIPVRDTSGSFRCYRVELLKQIDWDKFQSSGYSFYEEVLFRLRRAGASMKEYPITFIDRRLGSTKATLQEAWRSGWQLIRLTLCSR